MEKKNEREKRNTKVKGSGNEEAQKSICYKKKI